MKFSKSVVKSLDCPPTGQKIFRDEVIKGFGIRATPSSKSYIAEGLCNGVRRRVTIGRVEVISLDDAKKEALKILSHMAFGITAPLNRKGTIPTVQDAFDLYLAERPMKEYTKLCYRRLLSRSIADWLNLPITAITREMVLERHKELIKTTRCKTDNHTAANGTMRILKSVYGFAKERYRINGNPLITEDPTKVLRWRWYPSKIRQGTVPDTKLPQFFNVVMSAEAKVARDFIMFLLLTALRRNEAGRLKWENIDFENKTLTIPAGFNKSKRPHVLPLTPILLAILESRFEGRKHSDYVFPGRDSNKSINEPRQTLLHMRNIMGWHWLLHDLRRTALSAAEKAGVPYLAIQKIANHSVNQRVTDRYLILDVEFLRPHMLTMNERLMSCMNITVEKWQRLDEERLAMQRAKGGFSETAYLEITGCKRELAGKVITDVKTEPEEEEEFYW